MAFAICLEAALYWEFEAGPDELRNRAETRHRKITSHSRGRAQRSTQRSEQKTLHAPRSLAEDQTLLEQEKAAALGIVPDVGRVKTPSPRPASQPSQTR